MGGAEILWGSRTLTHHIHALALFLADQHTLSHYWKTHYADRTFKGDYRWNAFDICLLVPYFVVMIILAFYGIHRYQLVWLYYRNKRKAAHSNEPPARFPDDQLPFVTVQLPIYQRAVRHRPPHRRLLPHRLPARPLRDPGPRRLHRRDHAGRRRIHRRALRRAALEGLPPQPIVYLHRTNRHGYKAGALEEGLKAAKGELVAIFDADFVPPPDWLMQRRRPLRRARTSAWCRPAGRTSTATTASSRRSKPSSSTATSSSSTAAARRAGVFFNFNGTAGMWRRAAIDEAGGWQHDTLTEDTDLSYRAQLKGWKFKYLQDVECPAELPIEMTAFKTQQARWAKGLIQTSKKILPSRPQVRRALPHQARSLVPPHRQHQLSADDRALRAAHAGDDHPLLPGLGRRCCSSTSRSSWRRTMSISTFYLVSQQRALPAHLVQDLPLPAVPHVARHRPHHHQHQGRPRSPLRHQVRLRPHTQIPRAEEGRKIAGHGSTASASASSPGSRSSSAATSPRPSGTPSRTENYFTVPFLLLFVIGYWYTGLLSLFQGLFERRSPRGDAMHEKPYPVGV